MPETGLEKFYGRKTVLDTLRKRVLDFKDGYRQNVALVGDRHIGKSFILHRFLREVSSPDMIQVYVDAEYKEVEYFCRKIAGSILYEFSKNRELPLHEDLNLLLESTQSLIPRTVQSIRKIQKYLRQNRKTDAYRETVNLPQIFSFESGLFCLFVFDEFHCLEEWGLPEVFQELGKTIMTQRQCLYVFGSSHPQSAQTILSQKLSLLFGNFEVIEVGAFDLRTCQDYVEQHLTKLQISDDLRDFLIDFTGGHPLYLRLLCEGLVNLAIIHDQKEIFVPLLSRAIEDILFDRWGVLNRHFELMLQDLCSGKGNIIHADVLIQLSREKLRVKDLVDRLGVKQRTLSPRLNRLQEMGVITKSGKSFYIYDHLLRYWLNYVFCRRREAVDIDPARRRQQFRDDFSGAVDLFRVQFKKELSSQVMDLLYCFDDESFQMDGRRYKLPVFEKIASERSAKVSEGDFDLIRASAPDGDWAILLKAGEVKEQDLARIVSEVKQRFSKPRRCVLIALHDLDEAVRVRALQERMWIWNERELRTLLHIYNKPYIVVRS